MTYLFDRINNLVGQLSSLKPVGMYSMGEQVAVALNRSDRKNQSEKDFGTTPNHSTTGNAQEPESGRHDLGSKQGTKRDTEQDIEQDTEQDTEQDSRGDMRPEGAPWDAVLLTGLGLPHDDAVSEISAQIRHEGRLIVLVTFNVPTQVDAEDLADSWLEMNLAITAIIPSPTALLILAKRLSPREALLRQGRRELGRRRKTEWTEALGGCMKPEILHKDEVFVQYGQQPGIGDVALIQSDDGLVAHRILARVTLGAVSYVIQGGDRGGFFVSPQWAILGKVTAARSPGDESPRILPNRPQPAARILFELARLALPDQDTLAGRILRMAYHQAQQVLQLAQKLNDTVKNIPWPGKETRHRP